jgi:tetratricopeptide (TPR) repeat protein
MTQATQRRLIAVGLVCLTIAAHEGVRRCGFLNHDDNLFIHRNPIVRQGLTWRGVRWAFQAELAYDSNLADYWTPVTVLSRMLETSLFGLQPAAHHLVNLLIHCLNVLLAFRVFENLSGATYRSAFVAAVLAVHPLHVEAVAWLSARKDTLSCLFWLLTIGAYAAYARAPSARRMALVAATLALGLMSKPMVMTLPFVLLLLDLWPLGRWHLRHRLILEKWPLLLLVAASLTITLGTNLSLKAVDGFPLSWRVGNALDSYVAYLQQAVWPTRLAPGYPHSEGGLPTARLLFSVAVLGVISALALANRLRRPYLLVGWGWFLGALLPAIGLVQSGSQARADRFTYIPLMGISLAVAWLAGDWAQRRPGRTRALATFATVALVALAAVTRRQVSNWKDDLALFSHAVEALPRSPLAHNGLAAALAQQGDLDGSERELREALRLKPDFMFARVSLSNLLARMGRNAEGLRVLEDGLLAAAGEHEFERGLLSERQGRSREAAEHYGAAVARDPAHAVALYNWGNLLVAEGRMDDALTRYQAAWRLNPDNGDVTNNLGMTLLHLGRTEAALERLSEGVAFDPQSVRLRTSLGYALSAAGRHAEAIVQFQEALRLQPGAVEAREALDAAMAASRR